MFFTVLCDIPLYNVHVQNSSLKNHPPVFYFGPNTSDSYWITLKQRPIVSYNRRPDDVWYSVFKKNGWESSRYKGQRSFTLKHHLIPQVSYYEKIQPGQVLNQLLGQGQFDKDQLVFNLRKQAKTGKLDYDILPKSFIYPQEQQELKEAMKSNAWFIAKDTYGTMGYGIKLVNKFEKIKTKKPQIVQEYLQDTMTVRGHKFDMRVYLLITSVDPLIAYVYSEGYGKIAADKYLRPSESTKMSRHLTNFAQSSKKTSGCEIEPGLENFVSFGQLYTYLFANQRLFVGLPKFKTYSEFRAHFDQQMQYVFQKLLVALHPKLLRAQQGSPETTHAYPRRTYARYGADVMMLKNGDLKIIEVNRRPQQNTVCKSQKKIAPALLREELNVVGIPANVASGNAVIPRLGDYADLDVYQEFYDEKYSSTLEDLMKGKTARKLTKLEKRAIDQVVDEESRTRKFVRIFPTSDEKIMKDFQVPTYFNWLLHQWSKGAIKE